MSMAKKKRGVKRAKAAVDLDDEKQRNAARRFELLNAIRSRLGPSIEGWPSMQRYKIKTAIHELINYMIDDEIGRSNSR